MRARAALVLAAALLAFILSDSRFAILDDESEFVTWARAPVSETIDDYVNGAGQPEHPPLASLLLHAWMPVGGPTKLGLRIPSIALYLAGVLILAFVARRLGGDAAFEAMAWIGALWPFGFHFGRPAEWYSLAFFLVAALTLCYLRYLERESASRLVAFLLAAAALLYSSYYGWAIVACLIVDYALRHDTRRSIRFGGATLAALIIAFLPLVPAFAESLGYGFWTMSEGPGIAARGAIALYGIYALFVSESVAPWIWPMSIPAAACIAASAALMWRLLPAPHRRYPIYFAVLFGGMVVLNIASPKRLLLISGWLLLPFSVALAKPGEPKRSVLVAALGVVAALGWAGIVWRGGYAAPHFVEPWASIAEEAAAAVKSGGVVVTNSPSLRFDMNYSLHRAGLVPASALPGWVRHPAVVDVSDWPAAGVTGKVLLVSGVNIANEPEAAKAEGWLAAHCTPREVRRLVPDSGFELKRTLFPDAGQRPYRITVTEYAC